MDDKIISKPIYDNNGKIIGNVTGRPDHVNNLNNRDVLEQIRRDDSRARDNQERSRKR